jgi:Fe-S-cluster containining protein
VNCQACRGACCEEFTIPATDVRPPGPDERRWLELHATSQEHILAPRELRFECRCTALTSEGRCSIYSMRPMVCVVYKAGGPDCLDTVRRRRTPEDYQRIREAGDPERIHDEKERAGGARPRPVGPCPPRVDVRPRPVTDGSTGWLA